MSTVTVVLARDSADTSSTALGASPAVRILNVTTLLCLPFVVEIRLPAAGVRAVDGQS